MPVPSRFAGRGVPMRRKPSIGAQIQSQSQNLLTTGRRFERFDQVRQRHFWSMCRYALDGNGYIAGTRQLFVTPPGQAGQGFAVALTERETDWKSANRVPDNQNFEITELGISVMPLDSTGLVLSGFDTNNFLQNTVVSITYLTNSVPLGMASDFAQASGPDLGIYRPSLTEEGVTLLDGRIPSNGFAAPALRRRFKIPILLQHGETFSFELNIPRAVYIDDADAIVARLDFWATESFAEKS